MNIAKYICQGGAVWGSSSTFFPVTFSTALRL
jgi:hypothetical protein